VLPEIVTSMNSDLTTIGCKLFPRSATDVENADCRSRQVTPGVDERDQVWIRDVVARGLVVERRHVIVINAISLLSKLAELKH